MADTQAPMQRPLSPHLQIYRFLFTMAMSIVHRITGVALYMGTVLLAFYLIAAASGKGAFDTANWLFGSIFGRLVMFGYTWALIHHMLGGLRHFIWDFGHGFDAVSRQRLAQATLIGSVALTILLWIAAYAMR